MVGNVYNYSPCQNTGFVWKYTLTEPCRSALHVGAVGSVRDSDERRTGLKVEVERRADRKEKRKHSVKITALSVLRSYGTFSICKCVCK
jgi:hypothetical protein